MSPACSASASSRPFHTTSLRVTLSVSMVASGSPIRPRSSSIRPSAIPSTSFQIGGAVGVAILSTIAVSEADGAGPLVALTNGYQAAFTTAIAFAAFGLLVALLLLGKLRAPAPAPAAEAAAARSD
jgi:hypothetical protein